MYSSLASLLLLATSSATNPSRLKSESHFAMSQHRSVLASSGPVAKSFIPPQDGSLIFLPVEARSTPFGKDLIGRIQAQKTGATFDDAITDKTAGILWIDSSATYMAQLEPMLKQHKNIRWVQVSRECRLSLQGSL